jgi:predicted PurR-regulated permease PerM
MRSSPGYIALITIVIVSFLLMALVFSVSSSGFFSQSTTTIGYLSAVTDELADSCLNIGLLKLVESRNYTGNETVSVGIGQCTLLPILVNGTQKNIRATATTQGIITNASVVVETATTPFTVLVWKYDPDF